MVIFMFNMFGSIKIRAALVYGREMIKRIILNDYFNYFYRFHKRKHKAKCISFINCSFM